MKKIAILILIFFVSFLLFPKKVIDNKNKIIGSYYSWFYNYKDVPGLTNVIDKEKFANPKKFLMIITSEDITVKYGYNNFLDYSYEWNNNTIYATKKAMKYDHNWFPSNFIIEFDKRNHINLRIKTEDKNIIKTDILFIKEIK